MGSLTRLHVRYNKYVQIEMVLFLLTFCCGVCASILAMKMRWEMSSSQAYTKPGALVGLRMWKVLLQVKKDKNILILSTILALAELFLFQH